jgi:hypothetical protein
VLPCLRTARLSSTPLPVRKKPQKCGLCLRRSRASILHRISRPEGGGEKLAARKWQASPGSAAVFVGSVSGHRMDRPPAISPALLEGLFVEGWEGRGQMHRPGN